MDKFTHTNIQLLLFIITIYFINKTILTFMASIMAGMVHKSVCKFPTNKQRNVSTMDNVK